MSKQLLQEYFELCPEGRCPLHVLTESEKRNVMEGAVYLVGVVQKAGTKNGNGRVYRKETLKREIENYQKSISERRSLGELDHPDDSVINLKNTSHLVTKVWWQGDDVMGKIADGNPLSPMADRFGTSKTASQRRARDTFSKVTKKYKSKLDNINK